ncbi:hypothetical protein [Cupriavidus sp. BIC8F]|uniref:hypothetical protein n=1 Tax=Cupriavidus sp. BIC8F TaxID=3079014 RepID=UPI002915E53C|nr:hypothetical protein [Cupriavidus sp. BIC8F]
MKRLFVMLFALVAAACSDHPAPPAPPQAAQATPAVAAAPGQPVIVNNQAAPADSGIKDMLLGGALGYMMGSARSNHATASPAQQVIERRYYVRERAALPAPAAAPAPAPVAAAAPASPPPKAAPATPPAAKPFAYGAPPAPTPKVTYGSGFSQAKAAPAPAPRPSMPTYTSRPGSYSPRR